MRREGSRLSRVDPRTEGVVRAFDLAGLRFGKLVVDALFLVGTTSGTRKRTWWCNCDCGRRVVVVGNNLRTGNTRSCGCERDRKSGERCRVRNQEMAHV